MPATRTDLRRAAARQGAPGHHGQGCAQAHREGGEGAGGVHGRDSAHDDHRLFRDQRHRARHRVAAASFARGILRARPRQDTLFRQAPVFRARHSLPRLVARFRVRRQRLPLFPGRPPAQDAGDDPVEGPGLHAGEDPRRVLRIRCVSPWKGRRRIRAGARAHARRDGALRHHHQGRQAHRRQGQAHHGETRARHGAGRAAPHRRSRGVS